MHSLVSSVMHALTLELFQDNQYECSYCGNYTRHADASDSDHTGAVPAAHPCDACCKWRAASAVNTT